MRRDEELVNDPPPPRRPPPPPPSPPPPPPPPPTANGDDMQPGEALRADQAVQSPSGRYTLVYQRDGNLVLYKNYPYRERKALWSSQTAGRPVGMCIMQHDGNLVIYGPDGEHVWDSSTHGRPGARLVMQDDGNLVILDAGGAPIWATDTPRVELFHRFGGSDGWLKVTLRPDGTVRFNGHAHNGRIESVDFRIRAVVRCDQPVAVAMQKTGHLGNSITSGSPRDKHWDETSQNNAVSRYYDDFERSGRLEVREDREGRLTGTIWDVASHIADIAVRWLVGSLLITPGVGQIILVGVELGSLIGAGSLTAGARIIEGVLWMAGPYGTLYSLIGEGIATLGASERPLTDAEYQWAQTIFAGTLPPKEKMVITDTIGGSNRPFVFPRFDGKITLNLGATMFSNPIGADAKTFVHELVHAWQIEHVPFDLAWLADALSTQLCHSLGASSYNPGNPGPPFHRFNLEQQAEIVELWFHDGMRVDDPWYRYIEENIRMGKYY